MSFIQLIHGIRKKFIRKLQFGKHAENYMYTRLKAIKCDEWQE